MALDVAVRVDQGAAERLAFDGRARKVLNHSLVNLMIDGKTDAGKQPLEVPSYVQYRRRPICKKAPDPVPTNR